VAWVIEYYGIPPCWISEAHGSAAFDVTFQRRLAQRFTCREDAAHEILRLGLSGLWRPQDVWSPPEEMHAHQNRC
jgi:hypothetical protein